jgi:hypothetical protein
VSLNFVAGEFSPHNLPLQALLGLIGFGERITATLADLPVELDQQRVEPGEHRLDLALLGLLALHDTLLVELEHRGLTPIPAPAELEVDPHTTPTEADALRRLLR